MAPRESFLLRIDPSILEAVRRWAGDDLRSVNSQLEWIVRGALKEAGRLPRPNPSGSASTSTSSLNETADPDSASDSEAVDE